MMTVPLALLLGCQGAPPSDAVYRSGANAITRGARAGTVRVWGPAGTVERVPTPGANGTTLLGESGPLWIFDHDVPAPPKAMPVAATMVETAGYRMKPLLVPPGSEPQVLVADAAKSGGVYVRSVVKVRRDKEPPLYVVSATGDDNGSGQFDGPADVRSGANCKAALGLLDSKGEALLASVMLDAATKVCAVPIVLPPVDVDGDGMLDVLVYGQNGNAGFRSWFRIVGDTLVAGTEDTWAGIP